MVTTLLIIIIITLKNIDNTSLNINKILILKLV